MKRRGGVIAAALFASALYSLSPGVAYADAERVRIIAEKMKDKNASIRASATLSMGSTADDAAVSPLCDALADSDDGVRQAAAVSFKKLGARPGAKDCLSARQGVESTDTVKIAITRAIEAMGSDDSGPTPTNPNAKYYISLSSVANSTGRANADVEKIVLKSIRAKLDAAGTVQLAPGSEAADKARQVMKDKKLKGFYLAIAIDNFQYVDGNLKVKVKIGVFNYPNKSLLGNVDKSLTAQGVSSGDKSSEDRLLELAAGLAGEQFANNAQAFL